MPCPNCGGLDRDPIAPGFWRCTSLRRVVEEVGGPGLTNPFAGPPVIRTERLVACGAEYHEGAPAGAETCACGTFAIGRCLQCGRSVCGSHSALWASRRLCDEHHAAALAAFEAARAEAVACNVADAVARSVRAWDEWLAAARAALSASVDPIERTVRAVSAMSGGSWPDRREQDRHLLLELLLPEQVAGREPDVRWWWDHDTVQAWFLGAVKVPPTMLDVVRFRRTLLGGERRERTSAPGWSFPGGSTDSLGEGDRWLTVCVLADGRRLLGANADSGPRYGFNEVALKLMGELAQLELLPPFPALSMRHPQSGARVWPAA
jgi:hypothetical protein